MFTNLAIYKAIANESHDDMVRAVEAGRQSKPDGSEGAILSYDPNHTSFKKAMIVIAFTGMWLEALLHKTDGVESLQVVRECEIPTFDIVSIY